MKSFSILLWFFIGSSLISCAKVGLQGTTLPSTFEGVQGAVPISPTTIRLSWTLQARFSEYRIYRKGFTNPLKVVTFATADITGLAPDTFYEFSVTGVVSDTKEEIGYTKFTTVKTLPNFAGIPSVGGAKPQANGAVEVQWVNLGSNITYKVFARRENESWNLNAPVATVVNAEVAAIESLTSGARYCFWVMAHYLDDTKEPLNVSDAYLNLKAPCVLVQSLLPNPPTVKINSVFTGSRPWFTSYGNPDYTAEIIDRVTNTRVAGLRGEGEFRAEQPLTQGLKDLYVRVSDGSKTSVVDLQMDGKAGSEILKGKKPLIKTLEGAGAPTPLLPRLIGGGLGMQELGKDMVVGDFNCDGLKDVAISAPRATPYISSGSVESTGAVAVYYGFDPPPVDNGNGGVIDLLPGLKTDVAPNPDASAPFPQLIYYTGMTTNARMGTRLARGNVNGDCFSRYKAALAETPDSKTDRVGLCDDLYTPTVQPINPNKASKIFSCDDLAIQGNDGSVFMVFGDPVKGLVSGAGGNAFGFNETTCDPTSFKCRPGKYKEATTKSVHSITLGDFNNDGYDDLAMAVELTTPLKRQVQILRGDRSGLFPNSNTAKAHAVIDAASLPAGVWDTNVAMTAAESISEEFGYAIGTAYNSRDCVAHGGFVFRPPPPFGFGEAPRAKGFDFTKCDDLVIGIPERAAGRGSVLACKGVQSDTASDKQKIESWECRESYPNLSAGVSPEAVNVEAKRYGASILGVPNQNGYPLTSGVIGTTNNTPKIAGAVFVGAPNSTVSGATNAGVVFGYYVTPRSTDFLNGGIYAVLKPQQAVLAVNRVACNSRNDNVDLFGGTVFGCENQLIHTNPPEAGVLFGSSLGSVEDIESTSRGIPSFAVGAPNRTVASSNGQRQIAGHGVIYLYKPEVTFGFENNGATRIDSPQLSDNETSCAPSSTGCTWYSGGVNPFGASIIYAPDLTVGAQFGSGGIVGADFNGDGQGDLLVGAPFQSAPAYYNGSAFMFRSQGTFAAAVNTVDQTLNPNFSKELNYKYERAKIIGDINGDGYDDVMTHISVANTIELVVFYGSPSGLITTPLPSRNPLFPTDPVKLVVDLDTGFGREFHKIGSVNGDSYDDMLIIGSSASYIFYGSSSGVVASTPPAIAPVGQNPLRFATSAGVNFNSSGSLQGGSASDASGSYANFNPANRSVAFGDFNGDKFSDFAIGSTSVVTPLTGGAYMTGINKGRVFVFYGSGSGPQTDRTTGVINMSSTAYPVKVTDPCDTTNVCSVQILASNDTATQTAQFGWNVVGVSSLDVDDGETFDELVVSDPGFNANRGRVYLFKGTAKGLNPTPVQKLDAAAANIVNSKFGTSVISAGDINGDGTGDLVVSAPGSAQVGGPRVYIYYSRKVAGANVFYGFPAQSLPTTDLFSGTGANLRLSENALHVSTADPRPQSILSTDFFGAGEGFGFGLAAAGDINDDGYADVVVNMPGKDYDLEEVLLDTGAVIIYFGGPLGLKIQTAPSTTPKCLEGGSGVCEPALIYLPAREAYEASYLSSSPSGDINNDGVPEVLIGAPGRRHPSGQAFSTGVVYVLY